MARRPSPVRREALLQAACSVFVAQGFAASSVRQLAEAASLPATAVYTYFDDKDALLRAALAPVTEAVDRALAQLEADLPGAISLGTELQVRLAATASVVRFACAHRDQVLLLTLGSTGSSLEGWLEATLDRVVALEGRALQWLQAHEPARLRSAPEPWLVRAVLSMQTRALLDGLRLGLDPAELERRAEALVRYVVQANALHLAEAGRS